MNRLPLVALTSIGIFVGLYACGSSSSGDDDGIIPYDGGGDVVYVIDTGADAPPAAAGMGKTFCDATLGLIQNNISQCCSAAEKSAATLDLYKNIDTLLTQCETTLEKSIGLRRTAPSAAEYTACENAYQAEFVLPGSDGGGGTACQGLDAYRPGDVLSVSCAGAFVGVGATGAACAGNFDCASGLACIGYGAGTDGTCQELAPADGTCQAIAATPITAVDYLLAPTDSCASGFYCNAGTCKASVASGGTCSSDAQCGNGSVCIDTLCTTANTDGSRLPTGAYCTATADCNEGDYCKTEPSCPTGDPNCVPKDDGGAPAAATGVCTPSITTTGAPCEPTNAHECAGQCKTTGNVCGSLCTYP
jgi:hypothetical protein